MIQYTRILCSMPYKNPHILGGSNSNNNIEYYCNNKCELQQWLNMVGYNYRLPQ